MKKVMAVLAAVLLLLIGSAAAAGAPPYSGRPSVDLNSEPIFLIDLGGEETVYLPLDGLGRVQGASALLGLGEEQPARAVIQSVVPTGWTQANYGFVPGLNLYNRCHLLAHQLGGAEIPENLLTGTQYLNISGMAPIENAVAEYVRRTGNHVRMEVIPYFEGDNLVCTGVFMNAKSVEDDEISVCVFCYNVQPGVAIDYATGYSVLSEVAAILATPAPELGAPPPGEDGPAQHDYVLNTHTMRFHTPDCPSVDDMKEKNRQNYHGTREALIEKGYKPCGRCQP